MKNRLLFLILIIIYRNSLLSFIDWGMIISAGFPFTAAEIYLEFKKKQKINTDFQELEKKIIFFDRAFFKKDNSFLYSDIYRFRLKDNQNDTNYKIITTNKNVDQLLKIDPIEDDNAILELSSVSLFDIFDNSACNASSDLFNCLIKKMNKNLGEKKKYGILVLRDFDLFKKKFGRRYLSEYIKIDGENFNEISLFNAFIKEVSKYNNLFLIISDCSFDFYNNVEVDKEYDYNDEYKVEKKLLYDCVFFLKIQQECREICKKKFEKKLISIEDCLEYLYKSKFFKNFFELKKANLD